MRSAPALARLYSTMRHDIQDSVARICAAGNSHKPLANALAPSQISSLARGVCDTYNAYSHADRRAFLLGLVQRHSIDHEQLRRAVAKYSNAEDSSTTALNAERLHWLSEPDYMTLIRAIGNLPQGIRFLVELRAHVLEYIAGTGVADGDESTQLKQLSRHLQSALGIWFTTGLLQLHALTWHSPADILHKVLTHESVHPMDGWTDLRRRLSHNRRCFVFTHPSEPRVPLVVLHVALTRGIADNVDRLLLPDDPAATENEARMDTAIFYSVSNTQPGLRGIDLGNQLIKRVVAELRMELPQLHTFSTLSPIPGFGRWLRALCHSTATSQNLHDVMSAGFVEQIRRIWPHCSEKEDVAAQFYAALTNTNWHGEPEVKRQLSGLLLHLCQRYLCTEKHRGYALDPVAHFHLRNGAMLYRINWDADSSARGRERSFGLMANYKYDLDSVDGRSQKYMNQKVFDVGHQVLSLGDPAIYTAKL